MCTGTDDGSTHEEANTTMTDPKEDLRSTVESIRKDAQQVSDLEREKASLEPGDPRVDDLSSRVEHVIGGMQVKAAAERELADEIKASD
jgi:hypothetical protein